LAAPKRRIAGGWRRHGAGELSTLAIVSAIVGEIDRYPPVIFIATLCGCFGVSCIAPAWEGQGGPITNCSRAASTASLVMARRLLISRLCSTWANNRWSGRKLQPVDAHDRHRRRVGEGVRRERQGELPPLHRLAVA